jgi:Fis family transcriptional regulator
MSQAQRPALDQNVRDALDAYFTDLRGTEPNGLYALLLATVERPLLEVVMARAEGNQSRAAEWLGINRNTLRRKLLEHKLAE